MTISSKEDLTTIAASLAELGENFYRRGWVLGTSGNFSAVISRDPLRLMITASGMDKGRLTDNQFVEVGPDARVLAGEGRPSDETKLHLKIVQLRGAQAVLHTHSVWSTILSDMFASARVVEIEGYEMLKGLAGVRTHEHRELLPILENSQDMDYLANQVEETLLRDPHIHGLLLRGHGLYTWGESIKEAKRHTEILEFLLEVTGRTHMLVGGAKKQ
jgi:methylthioribulose-1-phosphate dehydratase